MIELEPAFVEASGRFATSLYKEEIEVLLRTSGYGGFSLLDLHDYPTQGTAVIGPLDAFWESKGFITPDEWRKFCGPTVPLLRKSKNTYASDEQFAATVDIAHYGPADLSAVQPVWSIRDEQGHEVAAGQFPALTVPTGKVSSLGEIKASLAGVTTPGKYTVTIALQGTAITNDWNIWIYPDSTPQPPAGVTICDKWEDAKAALADGKKVIFLPQAGYPKQSLRGSFLPVFWSPVWFSTQRPNTMGNFVRPEASAVRTVSYRDQHRLAVA